MYDAGVGEGRKRLLLSAASILAARKLAQYDGGKRVPATVAAISDAVRWAEEIMREIDQRWPTRQTDQSLTTNGREPEDEQAGHLAVSASDMLTNPVGAIERIAQ